MTRVFFHSPYAGFSYHSGMEAVLAHALAWRGARTWFTTCDGLFRECDVFRRGIGKVPHRVDTSCLYCQAQQATELAGFKQPFTWLGRYLTRDEPEQAAAFAAGLDRADLLEATWEGLPVGLWAQSSAFHQFRLSRIDLDLPEVEEVLRACIEGTVVSAMALRRAFDEVKPDVVVTFNGRFFSHRVALELGRARGARVVTHERGFEKNTIFLREGATHGLELFDRIWEDFHATPLSPSSLRRAIRIVHNRRYGKNLSWKAFSPAPTDLEEVRQRLALDDRPVVAAFTSSDDEWLMHPERREGPFPDSLDWIPATVAAARQSPELQWVVRFHPNLVGNGTNQQALQQAHALASDLPENCRFVLPEDDVSSYTLSDLCACGVVYGTTLGLEMAARGKPVVSVARGWYGHTRLVHRVDNPASYLHVVRQAVRTPHRLRVAREAHRFVHHLWTETAWPFPWVEETRGTKGRLQVANTSDLAPGANAGLDRLCDLIVEGKPLQEPPRPGPDQNDLEDFLLLQAYPLLRGDPERPDNALEIALTEAEQSLGSDPARARHLAERLLGSTPDLGPAWRLLAQALVRQGHGRPAHRAAHRATQLDPTDGAAWEVRLVLEAQRGQRSELTDTVAEAESAGVESPLLNRIRQALRT